MSKIAGLLLMIYGVLSFYLGMEPATRSNAAGYGIIATGALLFLVGLAHFKAPHKSFLASVPLLILFHIQIYWNSILSRTHQATLLIGSLVILSLSYFGYLRKRKG